MLLQSSPEEIQEVLKEIELNKSEIKNALMECSVYMDNIDYGTLLNMPLIDRDLLVKSFNKKIKKQNEKH
ncbi:Uncharacterised protein [Escherichia coli]|uniref:Uncharacterized protein n=5 Tax=Asteriusvirus TaxID=2560094 RepID=A0A1C3S7D4_9CAUD|nr:hypothetical protein PBI_121Q_595 [Escherichia phage 121Q]YP_009150840.1 hypothetical protein ACQ29_gp526 [Escherichia phage PBECO4]AXC36778.1 hypothetical protein [Escherichia phage UB]QBO61818.1 hypothetical protein G17_00329 [Escherichia phage vB_EcoM_G17]QDF13862.1 RIP and coiled-coil domain-containing 2 [Escherichia phage vB_EcoM_phAPEC6]UTS53910.1 hypothetical protein UES1_543 [Escherichia phage UE-S1]WIL00847.1 prohead core scaffolding protein and protease [Escherichia phage vB_EcoM